jgi:hypothetical protein
VEARGFAAGACSDMVRTRTRIAAARSSTVMIFVA